MKRIHRRSLLKYTLLFSAGLLGCDRLETIASEQQIQSQGNRPVSPTGKRTSKQDSSGKIDAIVVGAGIAGLGAANVLRSQGKSVLILEARNRIGGRIFTDRSLGNIPLDLGASWIHGTQNNPLSELTRQFGIRTLSTDYESMTRYDFDGTEISDDRDESIDDRFDSILEQLDGLREDMEENDRDDISLQQAVDRILSRQRLSPQAMRELNYAINTSIEHEYGADLSQLSLYNWDAGGEMEGDDVLFPDGYDRLTAKLAEGLTIELQHIVQKIEYSDRVKITTDRGLFTADRAIITLPLGVLKSNAVEFSPALPNRKQQAIARLGVGILNKLYLKFPETFWDEESELLGYMSQTKGEWVEFLNLSKYTQKPILLGFNAGLYGAQLEGFSDTQIVRAGMTALKTIYGQNLPAPDAWLMSRWQQDRLAKGSYSYIPKDASNDDRSVLAEPVGDRLFFAGEAASSEYAATVHGALLSGRQAARQMLVV